MSVKRSAEYERRQPRREFDAMDAVYATYFKPGRVPARTCIEASRILAGCRIEIDGIARMR